MMLMMLMMMKEKKDHYYNGWWWKEKEKHNEWIVTLQQVLCTGKEKPIKGGLEVQKMPHEGNNYIYFERSIN